MKIKNKLITVMIFLFMGTLLFSNQRLLNAVKRNKLGQVKKLIEGNKVNINYQDKDGNSALHEAVLNNSLDIVKYLIGSGADIELKNKKGYTALFYAVRYNAKDIFYYLVNEAKADIYAEDNDGENLIHMAASTYLNYVNLDILQFLFDNGVDINKKTIKDGFTPLHLVAINYGKMKDNNLLAKTINMVAEKLIELGADQNIKDNNNKIWNQYLNK